MSGLAEAGAGIRFFVCSIRLLRTLSDPIEESRNGPPMHSLIRQFRVIAAFSLTISGAAEAFGQTPLKDSPFLPPSTASAPAKGETTYELAGMSVAGKATLLSITRVRDKRSFWVPVGPVRRRNHGGQLRP